jgi:V-type H+-transporting ATPase 16kDa proteolipid subunit
LKAENGRKWYWSASEGGDAVGGGGGDGDFGGSRGMSATEGSNKLYVGMLIMLIFSEALALYGLIVALILSQHSYTCGAN